MKLHVLDASAIGAFGLASASGASSVFGWFNFVNYYAPGIGVFLSLFFGTFGAICMFRAASNKKEIDEIKGCVKTILDKIDKE